MKDLAFGVIAGALVGALGLAVFGLGVEAGRLWLKLLGLPFVGALALLWIIVLSQWNSLNVQQRRAVTARPPTPAPASDLRDDKYGTMRALIHDWAANGFMTAGDGNPTGIAQSRELAKRSQLPFSSEIWGEARVLAQQMRYNGRAIFAMQRGKGGDQLVRIQTIPGNPFNTIEAEWNRVSGKYIVRDKGLDRRAQPLT